MKNRSTLLNLKPFLIAALMIISVMVVSSCKKEMTENPTVYDPAIDGIAVTTVPDIDIRMADRNATVPGYRNTAAFEGPIIRVSELAAVRPITDPNFL